VIDVGPIGKTHIGKDMPRPIAAVCLEEDFFPKHHRGCGLLGLMAVGLALLRAVDAAQADTFRVLLVQDFNGIAVEDGDNEAMIVGDSGGRRRCQECEDHTEGPYRKVTIGTKGGGHRQPCKEVYCRRERTTVQEMMGLSTGFPVLLMAGSARANGL